MRVLRTTIGFFIGITIYELFVSLWRGEPMDWEGVFNFFFPAFTGILIAYGIGNFFKKGKG